jgi:hypothetical protein
VTVIDAECSCVEMPTSTMDLLSSAVPVARLLGRVRKDRRGGSIGWLGLGARVVNRAGGGQAVEESRQAAEAK